MRSRESNRMSLFSFQDIIMSVTGILVLIALLLALFLVTPSQANLAHGVALRELELELDKTLREANQLAEKAVTLRLALAHEQNKPDIGRLLPELTQLQALIREQQASLHEVDKELVELKAGRREEMEKLGLTELEQEIQSIRTQKKAVAESNLLDEERLQEYDQQISALRDNLNTLIREADKLWVIPSTVSGGREPLLVTVSENGIVLDRFNLAGERRTFPAKDAEDALERALVDLNPSKDYVVFYIRPSGVELYKTCKKKVE